MEIFRQSKFRTISPYGLYFHIIKERTEREDGGNLESGIKNLGAIGE